MLTGGQILVECLKNEGVEVIFGYPGGAVLPIYDALYDSDLLHVLTRHEQAAAHAADGYARATGRPGVCLATSGPGATNLVTGIATAAMDSVPMVAITGQVPTTMIGKDAFQEADITGITLPITKHNYLVRDVNDLPRIVKEAFYIATTGRPGPVLIDIPRDVSAGKTEYRDPGPIGLRGYMPRLAGEPAKIAAAAKLIAQAKRPVIYAGGGVINSGASEYLKKLAETIMAPVAVTLMGIGCLPGDHPLFLGMLGMHGARYTNYAVNECDLLLAIGVRFDDRVTGKVESFASHAKVIHIDIDPAEFGKNVPVDISIAGDVRTVLVDLIKNLTCNPDPAWQEKIARWKKEYPLDHSREGLRPQAVIRELSDMLQGRRYRVTTEVGQNQMWAAQHFCITRPRSFISSGGLGTMGYGFPAAIGVQVACPDELVFDIAGDGSIQMNIQELTTAVNYRLPVNVAILNNSYLGMVRQWQELFYNRRYSQTELVNPDFVKVAEAFGAEGIRVEKIAEVRPALEQAIASSRPVFLDFIVEREENVMPIVPPGEAISRMLG
ncbi:MAG: biosynthetic-type acetolactate synthase large subunit [Bacillota bacterium]|jgi:acetolactate synthase-1/2/3 large subunit